MVTLGLTFLTGMLLLTSLFCQPLRRKSILSTSVSSMLMQRLVFLRT